MKIRYILLILILCLLFVWGCFVGGYKAIQYVDYKASVNTLDKYELQENEKVLDRFNINDRDYVITQYHDDKSSYAHHNILLKYNNQYYSLEEIKECDMNSYLKDNTLYVHCIGKKGKVMKYTFIGINVEINEMDLNYIHTPNIDQKYIKIDLVGNKNIYLSSSKVDDNVEDGSLVKCSLKNNTCTYMKQ